MKSGQVAALVALLSAGAQAAPRPGHAHAHGLLKHAAFHHKRDIVWETVYEIETVTVMRTVYADGTPTTESTAPAAAPTVATTLTPYFPVTSQAPAPTLPSPSETGAPAPAPVPVTSSSTTTVAPAPAPVTTSAAPPPVYTTAAPVPTTTYAPAPAPAPSSSEAPAPAPVPSSASAPAPAPSAPSTGGGYGGSYTYSGDATHWDPSMGACGVESNGSQDVVAISNDLYTKTMVDGNPNHASACGKTVNIKGVDGQDYPATVVDRCMGCATYDLDMSITLFNKVTNNGDGRVPNTQWGSSVSFA